VDTRGGRKTKTAPFSKYNYSKKAETGTRGSAKKHKAKKRPTDWSRKGRKTLSPIRRGWVICTYPGPGKPVAMPRATKTRQEGGGERQNCEHRVLEVGLPELGVRGKVNGGTQAGEAEEQFSDCVETIREKGNHPRLRLRVN